MNPPAPGCPSANGFGPTGYEGPGTGFTNISSDTNTGTVTFSGGVQPGKSAYFGLENTLTAANIVGGQVTGATPPSAISSTSTAGTTPSTTSASTTGTTSVSTTSTSAAASSPRIASGPPPGPPIGYITGYVRVQGTNAPLSGVRVALFDTPLATATNGNGFFEFAALVLTSGYNGTANYNAAVTPTPTSSR